MCVLAKRGVCPANKFSRNLCRVLDENCILMSVHSRASGPGKLLFLLVCLPPFDATAPPRPATSENKRSAGGIFLDGSHYRLPARTTNPRGGRMSSKCRVLLFISAFPPIVSANTPNSPTTSSLSLSLPLFPLLSLSLAAAHGRDRARAINPCQGNRLAVLKQRNRHWRDYGLPQMLFRLYFRCEKCSFNKLRSGGIEIAKVAEEMGGEAVFGDV